MADTVTTSPNGPAPPASATRGAPSPGPAASGPSLTIEQALAARRERRQQAATAQPAPSPAAPPGAANGHAEAWPGLDQVAAPAPGIGHNQPPEPIGDAAPDDPAAALLAIAGETPGEAPPAVPAGGVVTPDMPLRVRIGDAEVPLAEIANGYLRGADYTQKTQAVAEARRRVEAEAVRAAQMMDALQAALTNVGPILQAQMGPEPDWQRLTEDDPIGAIQARAKWDAMKAQQAKIAEQQAMIAEAQRGEMARQAAEAVAEGKRVLAENIPGWGDPAKQAAMRRAIVAYGRSVGFSDAELSHVYDPRMVRMALDAALYRATVARGAAPKAPAGGKPPSARSAAAAQPAPLRQAREAFKDKANVSNAVALLRARRNANRHR